MRSLLACTVALGVTHATSAATFSITHFGTPPEAQAAIAHAAAIWGGILESDVPIKVAVSWFPLGSAALGVTFPNGRKDFPGVPVPSTWYATALANSITGTELNPGEDDINVYLNSSTAWYYGVDGNTPPGQYDLVSIALHEFGHGLGFVGLAKKVGAEGSFGQVQISDFGPLITTFPWPEQEGLPGIFDRHLTSTAQGELHLLENPGTALGSAFTSNQVYFNGPFAAAANAGQSARIYAPAAFALGSSCVHLNEATFPVGNPNELMTPFSSAGQANHWPGPIAIGVMRDIGWVVTPEVGMTERTPSMPWSVRLGQAVIAVEGLPPGTPLQLMDAGGRTVAAASAPEAMPTVHLAPGAYLLRGGNHGVRRVALP
jgi:hypothetical protein